MALCKNCGKQYLKGKEKFCSFCGKLLEEKKVSVKNTPFKKSKRYPFIIVLVLIIGAGAIVAMFWSNIWHEGTAAGNTDELKEAEKAQEEEITQENEITSGLEAEDKTTGQFEVVSEAEKPEKVRLYVPANYPSIQEAIDAAQNGDVIIVEAGTYVETIDFQGKEIILRSADPEDPETIAATVIDGNGRGSTVTFQSGEGEQAVLQGFTITGGSGTLGEYIVERRGEKQEYRRYYGGGILIKDGSSPTISQNIIRGNQVQKRADEIFGVGGGIAVINSSSPIIRGNIIAENRADGYGGGIIVWLDSNPLLEDNTIRNNSADKVGGGLFLVMESQPTITGNVVSQNQAGESAGGIYVAHDSYAEIVNNTIINNVSQWGAGIMVLKAEALLKDNQIENNKAKREGGGIYLHTDSMVSFSQNLIRYNTASNSGGGIWVERSAELTVLNENIYSDNHPQSVFYQP